MSPVGAGAVDATQFAAVPASFAPYFVPAEAPDLIVCTTKHSLPEFDFATRVTVSPAVFTCMDTSFGPVEMAVCQVKLGSADPSAVTLSATVAVPFPSVSVK